MAFRVTQNVGAADAQEVSQEFATAAEAVAFLQSLEASTSTNANTDAPTSTEDKVNE